MSQRWDPERYARTARFVSDLGAPVLDILAPQPGERILDLGCGDGVLTAELVARGSVVVGVDASAAQVEAARRRGLDARVMAGERLAFDGEFDAVFSNAALHWMHDADAVITGVRRALRAGGRFVGELGGHGCVARIVAALRAALAAQGVDAEPIRQWYFPTEDEYRARLEAGGFRVDSIALFPRPTPLPGDIGDWLETFAGTFLAAARDRGALHEAVRATLAPALRDADGRWTADYIRLRFAATRAD
ncbi:MAG TPA: methyltransferase domain-containing protein [Candidatus Binatia bacterium]|nr:methyltransferase domain-containing protein [Candidatus Binatia bacterium]